MQDNPLTDPEEFLRWKEHRLTQAYHQFLKDRVQMLALAWARGNLLTDRDQSQAETLGDLAHLSCDDVRNFYGVEGNYEDEHERN